jgi:hypothetical protein
MKRTITVYADVQVEVDLRKFSTETLMDEIKERGEAVLHQRLRAIEEKRERDLEEAEHSKDDYVYIPPLNSEDKHPLHGIYYALKFGKKDHAVDLMRDYLADQFGVVL